MKIIIITAAIVLLLGVGFIYLSSDKNITGYAVAVDKKDKEKENKPDVPLNCQKLPDGRTVCLLQEAQEIKAGEIANLSGVPANISDNTKPKPKKSNSDPTGEPTTPAIEERYISEEITLNITSNSTALNITNKSCCCPIK